MKRYAFATTEIYSAVYKKLTENGFGITVPIFSHSGYAEIHTTADHPTFLKLFKEATGFDYAAQFSTDEESDTKN